MCLHNVPLPLISKQEPSGLDGENGAGNIPVWERHCADELQRQHTVYSLLLLTEASVTFASLTY